MRALLRWRLGLCGLVSLAVAADAPSPTTTPPAAAPAVLPALTAPASGPAAAPPPPPGVTPAVSTPGDLFTFDGYYPSDSSRVSPWGGVEHDTGPGIGYEHAFTAFEGFVPLWQPGANSVLFFDGRGDLQDDGLWYANVGGGFRTYVPAWNYVVGANCYYDYSNADTAHYSQVGAGFEFLGRYLDVRGNAYIPTDRGLHLVGESYGPVQAQMDASTNTMTGVINPRFQGNNILVDEATTTATTTATMLTRDHARVYDSAMEGFDLEAGAPVPYTCNRIRAYAGVYNYQAEVGPQAWGAKGRFEAYVNPNIQLNLSVQNDRIFHTTVVFGAALRFPGIRSRAQAYRDDVAARLGDPVVRNYNIVIEDPVVHDTVVVGGGSTTTFGAPTVTQAGVVAINPVTGQPFVVEHVASYAAAGGNGTVEHPFQTLTQEQTGSGPNDILFAWAGSRFNAQFITLQQGQRFLGEGTPHYVTATQGTFLLPTATTKTTAPVIDAALGNAVTLSNNNEVSGFTITHTHADTTPNTGNGIYGSNVTGANINHNTISGSDLSGIVLNGYSGAGAIVNNTVINNGYNGVVVNTAAVSPTVSPTGAPLNGGNITGNITGNTVSNNTNYGIIVAANSLTGNVSNNTANNNGNTGIDLSQKPTSPGAIPLAPTPHMTLTGDLSDNTANGNQNFGINLAATSVSGNISNNTTNSNGNTGLNAQVANGVGGAVSGNTSNKNSNFGVNLSAASVGGGINNNTTNQDSNTGLNVALTGALNGGLTGNTANQNSNFGINVQAASLAGGVSGNTTSNNPGNTGLNVNLGGALSGGVTNNVANNNQVSGVSIQAASLDGGVTGNQTNNNAGNNGLDLAIAGAVTGGLSNNTADSNNVNGINLSAASLSGGVSGNTANQNAGNTGININLTGALTGGVSGNTANNNHTDGIMIQAASETGDVVNNTTNNNAGNTGFDFNVTGAVVGNVSGNVANNNWNYGINFNAASLTGDFTNNMANGNTHNSGINLVVDNAFLGSFSGNTANGNQNYGANVSAASMTGNVANNTTNNNTGGNSGLNFNVAGALVGNVTGNTADGNYLRGLSFSVGSFTGKVSTNTTNGNTHDSGFEFDAGTFNGDFSGNTANNNFGPGTRLLISGTGDSLVHYVNNQYANNGAIDANHNDVMVKNQGSGHLSMLLDGNNDFSSTAPPTAYELDNIGGGVFTLQQGTNTGTVNAVGTTPGTVP